MHANAGDGDGGQPSDGQEGDTASMPKKRRYANSNIHLATVCFLTKYAHTLGNKRSRH
jgi:hypothetical protein